MRVVETASRAQRSKSVPKLQALVGGKTARLIVSSDNSVEVTFLLSKWLPVARKLCAVRAQGARTVSYLTRVRRKC